MGNCHRPRMFYKVMGSPIFSPARRLLPAVALLFALLAYAATANASLDTYALGDGHEGAVQVTADSPLNYSAPLAAAASSGSNSLVTGTGQTGATGTALTTGSTAQTQFEDGRLILVLQSAGSLAGATSGAAGPFDLAGSSIGRWELARIASVSGDISSGMSITLTAPLEHAYTTNGAQVVAIPEFTDVAIDAGASWTANPWDGHSGGVTAFLATGTVDIAGSASIDASGAGFRGGELHDDDGLGCTQLDGAVGGGKGEGVSFGAYPGTSASNASRGNLANGGGGGDCANAGGGGGGNGGPGGRGGFSYDGDRDVGGMGGAALGYSSIDHAVFGGGGGAGDSNNGNGGEGGNGGGLVFVRADALTGSGALAATGAPGAASAAEAAGDGAGGGGGGGVVYARFAVSADCALVSAAGGGGGDESSTAGVHGPGGGGGGGRVLLQSAGGICDVAASNGAAGVAVNNESSNRGAQPAEADDPAFSGELEQPGGGFTVPTATVLAPADGSTLASVTPTISGSSSASFAEIRIVLDGSQVFDTQAGPTGEWSFSPGTALAEGSHSFTVQPIASGIAGEESAAVAFSIDVTPPEPPTVTGPDSPSASNEAEIEFVASPGTDALSCSLDDAPESTCPSSPVVVGPLSEGEHMFTVVAYDDAGNSASANVQWVVDTIPPNIEIGTPAADTVTGPDVSVEFTIDDAGSLAAIECSLDSGPFADCASPLTLDLGTGSHSVAVRVTDEAGNTTTATRWWWVDATPPAQPSIDDPQDGVSVGTASPTLSGVAEPFTEIAIFDDATQIGSTTADGGGNWSWTVVPPLSDGTHDFTVVARDAVGNESEASTSVSVTIDTTAPDPPVIDSPGSGPTANPDPVFAGTAEPGSTVRLAVDSLPQAQTTTAGPSGAWSLSLDNPLTEGSHTIVATATDPLGNTSTDSAPVSLVVDTTVPGVAILAPANGALINDNSPKVVFTAEAGAATRCKIDGGSYQTCSSPYSTADLADGEHTAYVEATDSAGNTAIATSTFTVDTKRPVISIDGGPATESFTNDTTPQFEFSADEPASFECALDSFSFSPCGSPYSPSLGATPDGEHSFHVRAADEAGNYSVVASRTWTVDTVPPEAPAIATPTDNAAVQTAHPVVSGTVEPYATVQIRIAGSPSGATPADALGHWSYATASSLSDAIYSYDAIATDRAGNASPASPVVHIRVDAANPTATIQSKPGSLANSSTSTFNFTADEAATFRCSLDGSTPSPCSPPALVSGLADGLHTFAVIARDVSGNFSTTAASWTWRIDTTGPVVAVTQNSPPAGVSPIFTFNPNEQVSMYRCRIDGAGAFVSCGSPFNAPTLPVGEHTLELRATDLAGNTSQKTVAFNVKSTAVITPPTEPTRPTTCDVGGEAAVPANIAIKSARAAKRKVTFTVRTDRYALIRISIRQSGKRLAAATGPIRAGARSMPVVLKRALSRGKTLSVRLSAVTLAGGKSTADASLVSDTRGRVKLAPSATGSVVQSSIDCPAEKGAKRINVKVLAVSGSAGSGRVAARVRTSDWAIATLSVRQGGAIVARKLVILRPKTATKTSLRASKGKSYARGRADVQVETISAEGVRQSSKRSFHLK